MNDFRRILIEMDIPAMRRAWKHVSPHLPQPQTDRECEAAMHRARTEARSVPLRDRAWSHRWLTERNYPSAMPDHLRPVAERMYPVKAEAVGISVNGNGMFKPITGLVRGAMEAAVLECFADGHRETEIVKPRMFEAKARTVKQLLGV